MATSLKLQECQPIDISISHLYFQKNAFAEVNNHESLNFSGPFKLNFKENKKADQAENFIITSPLKTLEVSLIEVLITCLSFLRRAFAEVIFYVSQVFWGG